MINAASQPDASARLSVLFEARSVAIIGASRSPGKISGRPIAMLKAAGFAGRIYPINPTTDEVQGLRSYPSLQSLPEVPEIAIIAVPRAAVPGAVTDCAETGVKAAILFTSGFGEDGPEGRRQEDAIKATAAAAGMRLLGPNCMGAFNLHSGLAVTFGEAIKRSLPRRGGLSIASQSGAVASFLLVGAMERRIGISKWVATGNEADIDVAECIAHFARDPQTTVIAAYLEGIRDGAAFRQALELARLNRKPVVLMKVGRSAAGAKAAATHTGSLAGDDVVFDAILRGSGAIRVERTDDLLDIAHAAEYGATAGPGRGLGLASISGGAGILMADAASDADMALPQPDAAAQSAIAAVLGPIHVNNPLDTTAGIIEDISRFRPVIEAFGAGASCSTIIAFLGTLGHNPVATGKLIEACRDVKIGGAGLILAMRATPESLDLLAGARLCAIPDPVRAVRAASALSAMAAAFDRPVQDAPAAGKATPRPATAPDEAEAKAMLAAAGIDMPREGVATSATDAARLAEVLGFPVALKVLSPDILHKSDIGGVRLGLSGRAEVEEAFEGIIQSARAAVPDADIRGVLVAPMVRGKAELILGTRLDPVFGPVVVVGLGGVYTEILNDVAVALAPVGTDAAAALLRRLKGYPLLSGARGGAALDVDAAASSLAALSRFAAENRDWVSSVEINPYVLHEAGRGGTPLDAVITLTRGD